MRAVPDATAEFVNLRRRLTACREPLADQHDHHEDHVIDHVCDDRERVTAPTPPMLKQPGAERARSSEEQSTPGSGATPVHQVLANKLIRLCGMIDVKVQKCALRC